MPALAFRTSPATQAIRFADGDESRLTINAVPFSGPWLDKYGQGQDLYGEHFSENTELCIKWFPIRPLLFQHGKDSELKLDTVGYFDSDSIKVTDTGVWIEAQLDAQNEYFDAIKDLIKRKKLFASSGAMAHLVDVDTKSGEILTWPWVEESLTTTPANLFATVDFADAEKHFKSAGLKFAPVGGLTMANLKAKLDAEAEGKLDDSDFAYIDKDGNRHLPIHDAEHVRAALSRFGETDFESDAAKKKAAKKILAKAKELDVDIADDDPVRKAAGEDTKKSTRKAMQESSDTSGGMMDDLPDQHDDTSGTHSHDHTHVNADGTTYVHAHDHTHDGDADHSHNHAAKKAPFAAKMSTKAVSYESVGSEVAALASAAVQDDPFDYSGWVYPIGTYDGYVILCRSDWTEGRNYYYRVDYERDADGHVASITRPVPVEMDFTPSLAQGMADETKSALFRLRSGVAGVRSLCRNVKSLAERRIKEGREMSGRNRDTITNAVTTMRDHHTSMDDAIKELEDFLNQTDPDKKADDATANESEPAAQAKADPAGSAKALSVQQRARALLAIQASNTSGS